MQHDAPQHQQENMRKHARVQIDALGAAHLPVRLGVRFQRREPAQTRIVDERGERTSREITQERCAASASTQACTMSATTEQVKTHTTQKHAQARELQQLLGRLGDAQAPRVLLLDERGNLLHHEAAWAMEGAAKGETRVSGKAGDDNNDAPHEGETFKHLVKTLLSHAQQSVGMNVDDIGHVVAAHELAVRKLQQQVIAALAHERIVREHDFAENARRKCTGTVHARGVRARCRACHAPKD